MGIYVDDANGISKEQFLKNSAIKVWEEDDIDSANWRSETEAGNFLVCLMDNGMFKAAGIADTLSEFQRFAYPDGRPKTWYSIPKAELYRFNPHLIPYKLGKTY